MEKSLDPYKQETSSPVDAVPVSSEALATMLRIKFWVKLAGMAMLGIMMLTVVSFYLETGIDRHGVALLVIALLFPLALLGIVTVMMFGYSSSIEKVRKSSNSIDLSASMKAQYALWIVVSVVIALFTGFYFLEFVDSVSS